jgi:hypothetical protein
MSALTWRADPLAYAGDPLTWGDDDVTIPGVETFHPRAVWEEVGFRMALDFTKTPGPYKPANVDLAVAHYSGSERTPDGDPGEDPSLIIPWLRAIQRDYYTNRTGGNYVRKSDGRLFPGYPIGYSFAVDWLGGVWELRGFEFLPAATLEHNTHTIPVIFITDGATPASDLALASARAIWREARRLSGRTTSFYQRPLGHGEVRQVYGTGTITPCPNSGILDQLHRGLGDLDYDDPPEDDMNLLPDVRRLIDTRPLPTQVAPGQVVEVATGHGDTMLFISVVAAETAGPGFVTVWGAGAQPATSNVNYDGAGQIRSSLATVQSDGFGVIRFTTGSSAADVVIDLQSYVG